MEKRSVQFEEGKVSYLYGGQGENLLLLHSLNLSGESWKEVFDGLARNFTVYALDMPGHGDSDKPPRNYLIEDYTRNVIQLLDRLKIPRAIVCGNSVGALIAAEMAASNPQRVSKLVLVGCPARDTWERMERLTLGALGFDVQGNPLPMSLEAFKMTLALPTPEKLAWFNAQRAKAGLGVKKTMIAFTIYDVLPRLPLIQCPTLILFGDQDILKEKENVLLQGIRGSKSCILKDAGHVPQMDQPQAFLSEISRFLNAP